MSGMSLDKILADLHSVDSNTKTASVASAPSVKAANAKTELVDALKRAESVAQKTASVQAAPVATPRSDLEKVAADLAGAEQEALTKEAQFYGAAIADGFMSRLGQYENTASSLPETKVASDQATVEKIAEEAVRGYIDAQAQIKVAAEAEYTRGYNDTVAEVEKVAAETFNMGIQAGRNTLAALRA